MNILDVQDSLKDLSEAQLIKEMQMPSGNAPQFLVLGEIQRRKRVRDNFAAQQAQQQQTVAQEAVAAMGIPQAAGMEMQQALNPNRSMVQNAPTGGIADIAKEPAMKMQEGGLVGGLFANTDRGREISSKDYEIRTGKDGRKLVYKKGTNIFMGSADKLFGDSQGYMEGGVLKFDEGGDTLGIRNMNPGNIRPGAEFFGETGSNKGYAQFKSPAHGLRAMARLFQTYKDEYDIDTIDEFVDRYAPEGDNDEKSRQNYKQFLADALNVGINDEVDLVARSDDLIPAVTKFENAGAMPYSDDMVAAAIKSSSVEDEAEVDSMLGGFETSSAADFSTTQATETEPSLLNKLGIVSQAAASTLDSQAPVTSEDQMKLDMIESYRTSDDPKGMDAEGTLKEIIRDTENNSSAVRVAAQQALNEIVSPKPASAPPAAPVQTDGMSGSFMDETFSPEPEPSTFSFMDLIRGDGGGLDPSNLAGEGGKGTGIDNPNNPLSGVMGSSTIAPAPDDPYNIGQFGEMGPPVVTPPPAAGDIGNPEDDFLDSNIIAQNPPVVPPAPVGASTTTQGNTVGMPSTAVTGPMVGQGSALAPFSDMGDQEVNKDKEPKFGSPSKQGDATTSTSSDLMAEIDELRSKLDKDRESDKWLALAQAGMALMSSTNPTMMGALGEAGMSGLKALRGSEDAYDKGVASLLSAKAKLQPKPQNTALTQSQVLTQINQITELLNKTVEVPDPTDPTGMAKTRQYVITDELERRKLQNLLSSLYERSGMQTIGDNKLSQAS